MLKYTMMLKHFMIFCLFLFSFNSHADEFNVDDNRDIITYKSFCVEEGAILAVAYGLTKSKKEADKIFWKLSLEGRCYYSSFILSGEVLEETYKFNDFAGRSIGVIKINMGENNIGYVLIIYPTLGV